MLLTMLLTFAAAIAAGLVVGEIFDAVEIGKAERRERRNAERWVANRINRQ